MPRTCITPARPTAAHSTGGPGGVERGGARAGSTVPPYPKPAASWAGWRWSTRHHLRIGLAMRGASPSEVALVVGLHLAGERGRRRLAGEEQLCLRDERGDVDRRGGVGHEAHQPVALEQGLEGGHGGGDG